MDNRNQENQQEPDHCSLLDRLEFDWPHWARYNSAVKTAIIAHFKESMAHPYQGPPITQHIRFEDTKYSWITKHAIPDNNVRRELHQLARIFGFHTESTGTTNRQIQLKTPEETDHEWRIQRALAMDDAALDRALVRQAKKRSRRTRMEERREQFKIWVRKKRCGCCGCRNDTSPLGIARDGSIMCLNCWEGDEELGPYKWEDLESCYVAGAI